MHPLALFEELEEGVPIFSQAEKKRIMAFKIPGEKNYGGFRYVSRSLYRELQEYYKEHDRRLAELIRASQ